MLGCSMTKQRINTEKVHSSSAPYVLRKSASKTNSLSQPHFNALVHSTTNNPKKLHASSAPEDNNPLHTSRRSMRSKERGCAGVMSVLGRATGTEWMRKVTYKIVCGCFRLCELVIYEVIMTQTNHLIRAFFLLRWLSSPGQSSHSGIFLGEMTLFPKTLESVIFFRHFFCGDDSATQTIHLIQAFFSVRWFSAPSQSSHSGIFLSEMTLSPRLPGSVISLRHFPQRDDSVTQITQITHLIQPILPREMTP